MVLGLPGAFTAVYNPSMLASLSVQSLMMMAEAGLGYQGFKRIAAHPEDKVLRKQMHDLINEETDFLIQFSVIKHRQMLKMTRPMFDDIFTEIAYYINRFRELGMTALLNDPSYAGLPNPDGSFGPQTPTPQQKATPAIHQAMFGVTSDTSILDNLPGDFKPPGSPTRTQEHEMLIKNLQFTYIIID